MNSRGQLAASALSELKTTPTLSLPVLSAVLVSGPPESSDWKLPAVKLYVLTRPCWHSGRCGHSAGPPRLVAAPEHLEARSERVFTLYLSENAVVTANAFSSWAWEAWPKTRPALSPS